jgi:DnaJ-class molecular chaperone
MERERKAVEAVCDACHGTGKRASEWDVLTGAVVAFGPCGSCLCRGQVLVNAPTLELVAA